MPAGHKSLNNDLIGRMNGIHVKCLHSAAQRGATAHSSPSRRRPRCGSAHEAPTTPSWIQDRTIGALSSFCQGGKSERNDTDSTLVAPAIQPYDETGGAG